MMTRRNVLRAVWHTGANANGGSNGETGKVPVFFTLAGPEAVFVIGSCVFTALGRDWALITQLAGTRFTTGSSLRALSFRGEKERCAAFARSKLGPMLVFFHYYWSRDVNHFHFGERHCERLLYGVSNHTMRALGVIASI
jgi:hypothetical protein